MADRVSEAQAYKSLIPQTTERLESASQDEGTRDGEMETKADEELGPVSVRTRVSIPMPDGSLQGSILGPVAAILMQILVAIVLALTSTVKMILVYYDSEALPGEMPATYHTLYVVGITIAATIISIFTTGQIRRLWVGIRHESLVDGNATDVYPRGFAVLLGLGSIPAQFLEYKMTLSLTVASLLTTAIVAGLSPKSVLGKKSHITLSSVYYVCSQHSFPLTGVDYSGLSIQDQVLRLEKHDSRPMLHAESQYHIRRQRLVYMEDGQFNLIHPGRGTIHVEIHGLQRLFLVSRAALKLVHRQVRDQMGAPSADERRRHTVRLQLCPRRRSCRGLRPGHALRSNTLHILHHLWRL